MPTPHSLFDAATQPSALHEAWLRLRPRLEIQASGNPQAESLDRIEERLDALSAAVREGRYEPDPLQEILIPKGAGKSGTRALHLPTLPDRILQEAVRRAITPRLERKFLDCSFAYRRGAGPVKAIRRVHQHIVAGECASVALGDIKDCFPSIDRALLLAMLNDTLGDDRLVALVEGWLSAGVVTHHHEWRDGLEGIPQGSALSPLLSNLYLTAFDRPMVARGARLVRYADDFAILARSPAEARAALSASEHILADRLNLVLNEARRGVLAVEEGFEFLGVQFVGHHRQLAPDRLEAMRRKASTIATRHPSDPRRGIALLAEMATGWGRYYGRVLSPSALVPLRDLVLGNAEEAIRSAASSGSGPSQSDLEAWLRDLAIPGVSSLQQRRSLLRDLVRRATSGAQRSRSPATVMRRRRRRHYQRAAEVGHLSLREPGTFVGKSGRFLVVRRDRRVVARVALDAVASVAVASHGVAISTDVITACAAAGVPILVESNDYRMVALLGQPQRVDARLAESQVLVAADPRRAAGLAAPFCSGKIGNQAAVVKYLAKSRIRSAPSFGEMVRASLSTVRRILAGLRAASLPGPDMASRAALMGLEAQAAAGYWDVIRATLPPDAGFERRVHEGATDPVNAMLNYGYAILSRRVMIGVLAAGLLPEVGFLHAAARGRDSLIYDAMEEFRAPIVDRAVLAMLGRREPTDADPEGRLTEPTRARLARHIHVRLATPVPYRGEHIRLEHVIDGQARAIAAHLRGEAPYRPFRMRW